MMGANIVWDNIQYAPLFFGLKSMQDQIKAIYNFLGEEALSLTDAEKKLIAGSVAGVVSRTATAPLERLRILMMAQIPGQGRMQIVPGIKSILEEGLLSFFKGNGISCLKVAPEMALRFYLFDTIKQRFSKQHNNTSPSMVERMISGGLAGLIAQFSIYPLDTLKIRYSLCPKNEYSSIYNCIRTIVRNEGARGIFAGIVPSMIGIIPFTAIDLSINSVIKESCASYLKKSNQEPGAGVFLLSGMISSFVGVIATAPINIVRTRLQSNGLLPLDQQYKGLIDVVRRTYAQEGLSGFYWGLLPNLMKVIPTASITYAIYDLLTRKLISY